MRLFILSIIMMVMMVDGAARNRNGLSDDTAHVDGLKYGTSVYTRWMVLGDAEDAAVIVKVRDTTVSGFASDSIAMIVGYQVGDPVFDSSNEAGEEKVARSAHYILDTLYTDSLGKAEGSYGWEDGDGVLTFSHGRLDTTNVYGWATWRRGFYPEWGVFIRFFFIPLSGHCNTETPCEVKLSRRQWIYVRNR